MQKVLSIMIVAVVLSGCASLGRQDSGRMFISNVRTFPSPLASDADFVNLVNDNPTLRDQAFKNVFTYYNCLVKASGGSYQRQDPTVLNRSDFVTFSAIPSKIHDIRVEKLANLVTDQNKQAMQSLMDAEVKDLSRIKWDEIKNEVNAIITGGRRAELAKYPCPLSDSELFPHGMQLAQEWRLRRPVFFPPFM